MLMTSASAATITGDSLGKEASAAGSQEELRALSHPLSANRQNIIESESVTFAHDSQGSTF